MSLEIKEVLTALPVAPLLPFPLDLIPYKDLRHRNVEVTKVYTGIISDFRYLLSRMTSIEHRTYLMASYEKQPAQSLYTLFEFVCVMCSITLYVKNFVYYMELETESGVTKVVGDYNYRNMLRMAYRATNDECTRHNLEDSINFNTDVLDHYAYFTRRIADRSNPDSLIGIEDAIVE